MKLIDLFTDPCWFYPEEGETQELWEQPSAWSSPMVTWHGFTQFWYASQSESHRETIMGSPYSRAEMRGFHETH
jgi:hypothetical protein